MSEDENGFSYPSVNLENCSRCGACARSCHVLSGSNSCLSPEWWGKSKAWVYRSSDKQLVENSTSGGAFSLFASLVLAKGGVVYASRYNGIIGRLEFADTDHFDLGDFRKSRYFESNMNDVFPQIKEHLISQRMVLFCGTPCQVAGLNSYLGRTSRETLLTLNFICHGVPSNKHFHQWLHAKYPHLGSIENVDFRYKSFDHGMGWHDMYLAIKDEMGKIIKIPYNQSSFYLSFINNDLLRESCYDCHIINGFCADVTMADFWGVNKSTKIKDDNTGLSLLIIHSEKAMSLLNSINKEALLIPLDDTDIEYAFQPRNYSLKNRELTEIGVRKFGYVKYMEKRYRWSMLKYRVEDLLHLKRIMRWVKK